MAPVLRNKSKDKKVVLVTSSAAPALLGRMLMRSVGTLKRMGGILGAKPIGALYIGLAATQDAELPPSAAKKARTLGKKLAS